MDGKRFDRLTVRISATSSRRRFLSRLTAATLGPGIATRLHHPTTAKKKRKKLQRNAFGCVNVGGKCRGNSANCCSGICDGRKPKKGKKDKSRCVAHDASTCQASQNACGGPLVPCTTSTGQTSGVCFTTTGNAPYCGALDAGKCVPCAKDADCLAVCGEGSACVRCSGNGCLDSGGFACMALDSCQPPAR